MKSICFQQLFEDKIALSNDAEVNITKLIIPKIQRDYVQGRQGGAFGEDGIRDRFVSRIYEHLVDGSRMELDFIYGISLSNSSKDEFSHTLYPLDGQQRLTTLYLFHWYLLNLANIDENEYLNWQSLMGKFSYETRMSSKSFCHKIANIDYRKAAAKKLTPSKYIESLTWFKRKEYQDDMTVQGMLTMLDTIHYKYDEFSSEGMSLFENLSQIRFKLLPLDEMHYPDNIYIQMNARGKTLNSYENFKADMIAWMKKECIEDWLEISARMDNNWVNCFYRDETYEDTELYMFEFINRYFANKYICSYDKSNDELRSEKEFMTLLNEASSFHLDKKTWRYSNFDIYNKVLKGSTYGVSNFKCFIQLMDTLSTMVDGKCLSELVQEINMPVWETEKSLPVFIGEIDNTKRPVLFGITSYLERFEWDEKQFKEWLRIVWNVTENTVLNTVPAMAGLINRLNDFAEYANALYEESPTLLSRLSRVSGSAKEELIKAEFIHENPEWETHFIQAESHPFFKGRVNVLMEKDMTLEQFDHRFEMASLVLDEKKPTKRYREGHLFLRALISQISSFEELCGTKKIYRDSVTSPITYFKNLLCSDDNPSTKSAAFILFNEPDEESMHSKMLAFVEADSPLTDSIQLKMAHETFYKSDILHTWMNKNGAHRLSYENYAYYVAKEYTTNSFVVLGSYRHQIVNYLIDNKYFRLKEDEIVPDEECPFYRRKRLTLLGVDDYDHLLLYFDESEGLYIYDATLDSSDDSYYGEGEFFYSKGMSIHPDDEGNESCKQVIESVISNLDNYD